VGMRAEPVIEAASTQPVSMRDLDGIHARLVQRPGNGAHVIQPVPVKNRMHPVPQCHILDVDLGLGWIEARLHVPNLRWRCRTICSAVASAADVMMSRLPAYAGR